MSENENPIRAEVVGEDAAQSVKERSALAEDNERPLPPTLTPEQERKLWSTIDRRLLPILTLLYICSFLDRSNISTLLMGLKRSRLHAQTDAFSGNAELQGLTTQLHLDGSEYNIALVSA